MNPLKFFKKNSKIEIILRNKKKLKLEGELTTTKNWAVIENQQEIITLNREELTIIKVKK